MQCTYDTLKLFLKHLVFLLAEHGLKLLIEKKSHISNI